MRRLGLLVVPVLAAIGLLVAGCGNYTEEKVSPLPNTVSGKTTAAATTEAATSTEATATEATTTAEETVPAEGDAAAAGDTEAGKAVFASAGCAACHTLADAGASGAVGPNLDQTKPTAEVVRDRVENGKGAMPPFKAQLSAEQIDDVVAYVAAAYAE